MLLEDYSNFYLTTYQSVDALGANSELIFVFRGTDALYDMWVDLDLLINYTDTSAMNSYVAARDSCFALVKAAIEQYPATHEFSFTGHSLGGTLALDCRWLVAKDTQLFVIMQDTPSLMVFNPFVVSTPEFVDACAACEESIASPGTHPWKDALIAKTIVNINLGDWAPVLFKHQGYGTVKSWPALDPVDLVGSTLQGMTWGLYNVHDNHRITAWTHHTGVTDRPIPVDSHPYAFKVSVDDPSTLLDEGNVVALSNSKSYSNHQLAIRTNPAAVAAGNPISANLWILSSSESVQPPNQWLNTPAPRYLWQVHRLEDAPHVVYTTQDATGQVFYHIRYWLMVTEPLSNQTFYVSPEFYRGTAALGEHNDEFLLHYSSQDPRTNAAAVDQILQLTPGLQAQADPYQQIDPVAGHLIAFVVTATLNVGDADALDRALWRFVDAPGMHIMSDLLDQPNHGRRLLHETHYVQPKFVTGAYASLPHEVSSIKAGLLDITPVTRLFQIESVKYPGNFLRFNGGLGFGVFNNGTYWWNGQYHVQTYDANVPNDFKFYLGSAVNAGHTAGPLFCLGGASPSADPDGLAQNFMSGQEQAAIVQANGQSDIFCIDLNWHATHGQNNTNVTLIYILPTMHMAYPFGLESGNIPDANNANVNNVPTEAQFKIVWV